MGEHREDYFGAAKIKTEDCDDLLINSRQIFAFGEIDTDFSRKLARDILHLASVKKDPLTIFLSSPGGDVGFGLGLYDLIYSLPFEVTIVGVGEVASAATIILQAADYRYLTDNSYLMLHTVSLESSNTLANVDSLVQASKVSYNKMIDIYAAKSNLTKKTILSKLNRDWYLTSDEAIELGFIDGKYRSKH